MGCCDLTDYEYLGAVHSVIEAAISDGDTLYSQLSQWDDATAMGNAIADLLVVDLPNSVPATMPPGWSEVSDVAQSGLADLRLTAVRLQSVAGSGSSADATLFRMAPTLQKNISTALIALRKAESLTEVLLAQSSTNTSGAASTGSSSLTTVTDASTLETGTSTTETGTSNPGVGTWGDTLRDGAAQVWANQPFRTGAPVANDVAQEVQHEVAVQFSLTNIGSGVLFYSDADFLLRSTSGVGHYLGFSAQLSDPAESLGKGHLGPGEFVSGYLIYSLNTPLDNTVRLDYQHQQSGQDLLTVTFTAK